jgi:hypothetical protein
MYPFREDYRAGTFLRIPLDTLEREQEQILRAIQDAARPDGFFQPEDAASLGKSAFHIAEEIFRRKLEILQDD